MGTLPDHFVTSPDLLGTHQTFLGTLQDHLGTLPDPLRTLQDDFKTNATMWKIEFSPGSGELPETVTQRMSPLGIAQWKIEFSPIAPNGDPTNEPPWGSTVEN